MMRRAERPFPHQIIITELTGKAVYRSDFQRLLAGKRRQNRGETAGKKRFAAAGYADQKHIMAAGGGDLHAPFHQRLPFDVFHINVTAGIRCFRSEVLLRGDHGLRRFRTGQQRFQLREGIDTIDRAFSVQRRFLGIGRGNEKHGFFITAADAAGHGQYAVYRGDGTVQRQLTQKIHMTADKLGSDLLRRGQQRHGNGKIETGTVLFEIRRGEIHDDPLGGKNKAGVFQRRFDPLTAFPHRRFGQTHNIEGRDPVGNIRFNGNDMGLQPIERYGVHLCQHRITSQ